MSRSIIIFKIDVISLVLCLITILCGRSCIDATISSNQKFENHHEFPFEQQHRRFTPLNTPNLHPLIDVDIIFNDLFQKPSIQTLETTTHSTLTTTIPMNNNQDSFYPFGKSINFTAKLNNIPSNTTLNDKYQYNIDNEAKPFQNLSTNDDIIEFSLSIHDITGPISTNPSSPSSFTTSSMDEADNDDGEAERIYSTHTIFRGTRKNPYTNNTDTILLSIVPNTGDYASDNDIFNDDRFETQNEEEKFETQSKEKFETQGFLKQNSQVFSRKQVQTNENSLFDPLNSPIFSPLSSKSYTIEGMITLGGNNDGSGVQTYRIQSISSLLFIKQQQLRSITSKQDQLTSLLLSTQQDLKFFQGLNQNEGNNTDDEFMLEQNMAILGQLAVLEEQLDNVSDDIDILRRDIINTVQIQSGSSYDLAIFQVTDAMIALGGCGVTYNSQGDDFDGDNDDDNEVVGLSDNNTKNNTNSSHKISQITDNTRFNGFHFKRWISCHRHIDAITIFTLRAHVAHSLSLFSSDSTTTINEEKVTARIKFLIALVNEPYYQQLGIIWQISSLVIKTQKTNEKWNVSGNDHNGCNPNNASWLLSQYHKLRHNNDSGKEQLTAVSHLFFHCPISTGMIVHGIHYASTACKRTFATGWTLIVDPVNDWTTTAHELAHSFGNIHPWRDDSSLIGKFGGLGDYFHIRLRDDMPNVNERRFLAFNEKTDRNNICKYLESIFTYVGSSQYLVNECFRVIQTDVTDVVDVMDYNKDYYVDNENDDIDNDDYIDNQNNTDNDDYIDNQNNTDNDDTYIDDTTTPSQTIMHDDNNTTQISQEQLISPTCGNGTVEAWEDCDVINACCNNCRFVANATCDGINNQCCQLCQDVPFTSRRCDLGSDSNIGVCVHGHCQPISLRPIINGNQLSPSDISRCPNDTFFGASSQLGYCGYTLPIKSGHCQMSNQVDSRQSAPIGTTCSIPSSTSDPTINRGICLPTKPFDQTGVILDCINIKDTTYTWLYVPIQHCNCQLGITENKGIFVCKNASARTVSSSYCSGQTYPPIPTCGCDSYLQWSFGQFQDKCSHAGCGFGVQIRPISCQMVVTTVSSLDIPGIDNLNANNHINSSNNGTISTIILSPNNNNNTIHKSNYFDLGSGQINAKYGHSSYSIIELKTSSMSQYSFSIGTEQLHPEEYVDMANQNDKSLVNETNYMTNHEKDPSDKNKVTKLTEIIPWDYQECIAVLGLPSMVRECVDPDAVPCKGDDIYCLWNNGNFPWSICVADSGNVDPQPPQPSPQPMKGFAGTIMIVSILIVGAVIGSLLIRWMFSGCSCYYCRHCPSWWPWANRDNQQEQQDNDNNNNNSGSFESRFGRGHVLDDNGGSFPHTQTMNEQRQPLSPRGTEDRSDGV